MHRQVNGGLGSRLHVQLDNTCGENKNKTVIAFLAWLVYADIFEEAGFFCLMKGHTFTLLDQSFGTLIKGLKAYAVYTISRLLYLIRCATQFEPSVLSESCMRTLHNFTRQLQCAFSCQQAKRTARTIQQHTQFAQAAQVRKAHIKWRNARKACAQSA